MNLALSHFEDQLKKVRTGRSHPDILKDVVIEMYGQRMAMNQVANVTAPEAQMLIVTPYDPSGIQVIANAIRNDPSLGFNPSDDGRVVRVPIPALTEERRKQLVKQTLEKVEEVRIALRNIRQDALKEVKRKKEAKELSEDDAKRIDKEFDKLMTEYQEKINAVFKSKEKDILTI